jgi:hypothetical protein
LINCLRKKNKPSLFADMNQALGENSPHMLVFQRIVDHLPFAAALHKPRLPKGSELVGNGGLAHAQKGRDVADTHFSPQKGAENFYPGGIAENFK